MDNTSLQKNIEINTEVANNDLSHEAAVSQQGVEVGAPLTNSADQISTVESINSEYHSSYTVIHEAPVTDTKIFNSTDWMVGILLFSIVVFLATKIFFRKQLSETIKSIFNYHLSQKLARKNNKQKQVVFFLVNLIFALNFALFSVQTLNYFHIKIFPTSLFSNFILFFSGILLIGILRKGLMNFFGFVLKRRNSFDEYTQNISLFNKSIGLALFPFIVGVPFIIKNLQYSLIIVAFIVIFIIYTLRILRGLRIIIQKQVSVFYTILYLCTLEIIPALLLYKTSIVLINSDIATSIVSLL